MMGRVSHAQAKVGFLEEANNTALKILESRLKHCESEYVSALSHLTIAQIAAGHPEKAAVTAVSIDRIYQSRDDTLNHVIEFYIDKRNDKAALDLIEQFRSPSRKAIALLKLATTQAKAGDRDAASNTASQVDLKYRSKMMALLNEPELRFTYLQPQSWGFLYDSKDSFTMASHRDSMQLALEVATAAMELAQAMGFRPSSSYSDLFDDVGNEVAQALARAHASTGDPKAALSWAQKIGSGEQIVGEDRYKMRRDVERRVHALIGVAEGMLERSKK